MPTGFPPLGGAAYQLAKPPPGPPAFPPPSDDVDVLFQPPTHKEAAMLYSPSRVSKWAIPLSVLENDKGFKLSHSQQRFE
jgi:hypothetical protein